MITNFIVKKALKIVCLQEAITFLLHNGNIFMQLNIETQSQSSDTACNVFF